MPRSILLIGGARSGKSRTGQSVAESSGEPVTIVVTAEPFDDEMTDRIGRHRADRPATWTTIEAPLDLADGVAAVPDGDTLLLDCLTLWISNRMLNDTPTEDIEAEAERVSALLAARSGRSIVISNEVGLGIVPGDPVSRAFRDVHGRVNQIIADCVEATYLVVAGRLLPTLDPLQVLS
ncbi:MAG: bifunctional adenosylcobinamide kinase/adenosylcobinamide-phosphate guanylyltransferase [Acidimicrobiales bacterium]